VDSQTIQRYRDNWTDERNSAAIYQALSDVEKDERLKEVYRRMAKMELLHAARWEKLLKDGGVHLPPFQPMFRTRVLIWMAKRFGPGMVLPGLQAKERGGSGSYSRQPEAHDFASQEASHSILLGQITRTVRGGMDGSTLAMLEGRHRSTGGNALRAAVLGANDGLVSNLSLVMGVAGASLDNRAILITGMAGLLAGAISMALGEWLSVQSSRELYAHQIEIEAIEVEDNPQEEAEELALIYEARGVDPQQARSMADQVMSNKDAALQTLAREELGIDPEELGGSAWEAAITSFILFAVGAVIPVIPFTFLTGMTAVLVSVAFSVVGLFLLGAIITFFTGLPVWKSGLRMVVFGLLAAAVTFGIGKLIGGNLGG